MADITAVIDAPIRLVEGRRRFLELAADRALPGTWEADLEKALAALKAGS